MATERYRRNAIVQIQGPDGLLITDHREKSALFWNEFKERLGVTVSPTMVFDLDEHFDHDVDLSDLISPFSKEEIDDTLLTYHVTKLLSLMGLMVFLSKNLGILSGMTSIHFLRISIIIQ